MQFHYNHREKKSHKNYLAMIKRGAIGCSYLINLRRSLNTVLGIL